ncbi:MAG: E3 binding domain-containing protein, partial [Melioribacter sp.]|nr:E3 binding domain-containing protein [Melioribacter sp.]
MTVDFRLPFLGDGINNADVIKVLVKPGDTIDKDQVVVEIETDKATVEVPSEFAGKVKEVFVKEGTKANVGEALISVEVSEQLPVVNDQLSGDNNSKDVIEVKSKQKDSEPQLPASQPPKTDNQKTNNQSVSSYEFKIPPLGENISSAQITKVLVKSGDKIAPDQIVLEIETDKATVEIPTEVGGIVKEVKVKDGDKVPVGSVAFTIKSSELRFGNESKSTDEKSSAKIIDTTHDKTSQPITDNLKPILPKEHTHMPQTISVPKDISKVVVPAAPSVRRFAREIGIEISNVRGSGPGGRISIEDVKSFAKNLNQQIQKGGMIGGGVSIPKETLPDFSKWGEID